MIDFEQISGFDWDEGNARKNEKHGVSMAEAEQVFFNDPLLLLQDAKQSGAEPRFHALGRSDDDRLLHIALTLRDNGTMIRVNSARERHSKERKVYEQET